jgi:hypothetical protein
VSRAGASPCSRRRSGERLGASSHDEMLASPSRSTGGSARARMSRIEAISSPEAPQRGPDPLHGARIRTTILGRLRTRGRARDSDEMSDCDCDLGQAEH